MSDSTLSKSRDNSKVAVVEDDKIDLEAMRAAMQAVHDSGVNRSYEWRMEQLGRLQRMVAACAEDLAEALDKDLGRHHAESLTEMFTIEDDLQVIMGGLKEWLQPERVPSTLVSVPSFSYIVKTPLQGPACLIIGPFNYPVILVLQPMLGALAAGNPVVLKPSELTPNCSRAVADAVGRFFDPSVVSVVQGGAAVTTQLLSVPWGKIFFTGSGRVGKIVASAAAQTLTPTALELGGKSPVYVDETSPADMNLVANRILWGKTFNAGQTCVAPDTLFVHKNVAPKLLPAMVDSLKKQFGEDAYKSELSRLVNCQNAERIHNYIVEVEKRQKDKDAPLMNAIEGGTCKILCGGSAACKVQEKYIEPTIILNPPADSLIMKEEIFGPVLPVVVVDSREQAVAKIRALPGTPLSMFVFTRQQAVFEDICRLCPAAGVMRNDCSVAVVNPCLPFGGLGTSGNGVYHGKHSFELFSHSQQVMYRPAFTGCDLGMLRYHPFEKKYRFLTAVLRNKPAIPVIFPSFRRYRMWMLSVAALTLSCLYTQPVRMASIEILRTAISFQLSIIDFLEKQ